MTLAAKLAALKAAHEGDGPRGRWVVGPDKRSVREYISHCPSWSMPNVADANGPSYARHIAAFDPVVTAALVAVAEAAISGNMVQALAALDAALPKARK